MKLKYTLVNVTYCQARKRKQTTNNNNLEFELHIENICQKAKCISTTDKLYGAT